MNARWWTTTALVAAGAAHAQTFDPSVGNPTQVVFRPETATRQLFELGWCGINLGGHVPSRPGVKLTLPRAVTNVRLRSDSPFVLMLPGNRVFCSNNRGEVTANELPQGTLELFPVGKNPKAMANADYGYAPGGAVTLELDAQDEPLRLGAPLQSVTWGAGEAPLVVRTEYPAAGAKSVLIGDVAFGAAPLALVEVTSAMDGVAAEQLHPPLPSYEPVMTLVPLDAPRKKQREWLAGENPFNTQLKKPLLPGRYALLSSQGAGAVRYVLSQAPQPVAFVATTERDLAAFPEGLAALVLALHAPFLEPRVLDPKTPQDLKERLALWKALPPGLRVTLVLDRETQSATGEEVLLRAGEPLLVTAAGDGKATVVTLDGLTAEFDDDVLTRKAPAKWVVPPRARQFESTDDDSLLLFKTPALEKLEARFKDADAKASACWQKNYNPMGQNYDVVSYRNGRVVNVESLDDRFRKQAEKACKAPLGAAEKLRAEFFKALAPEAKKQREQAWAELRALFP